MKELARSGECLNIMLSMSELDPIEHRRRQREAAKRRTLTLGILAGGVVVAGLLVIVAVLVMKKGPPQADAENGTGGQKEPPGPKISPPSSKTRPSGKGPESQAPQANKDHEFLRWAAVELGESHRISGERPGNAVAQREAQERWESSLKSRVGAKVSWPAQINFIEEVNKEPAAFVCPQSLELTDLYRIVLYVGSEPPVFQDGLRAGQRIYPGAFGPVFAKQGSREWLERAATGRPAIVSGTIKACLGVEEEWWPNPPSGAASRARQMTITVILDPAELSSP